MSGESARLRSLYEGRTPADPDAGEDWVLRRRARAIEKALREAGLRPDLGARALEAGCGGGRHLALLSSFGFRAGTAHGIDLAWDRLRLARGNATGARVVCADAASLPYGDGTFDLVLQVVCFSSVLDPAHRARMARELWRVLTPGGVLLWYDLRPTPWARLQRWLVTFLHLLRPAPTPATADVPVHPIPRDELRSLFPEARIQARGDGLDPQIARAVRYGRLWPAALASLPGLRCWMIATARKHDSR